jgi:hypothetical protein
MENPFVNYKKINKETLSNPTVTYNGETWEDTRARCS